LVCSTFPTHMGIRVGTIVKVMKNRAAIRFERPAAVRDGLLVISGTESAGFALSGLENGRSFVSEGQTVTVDFPSSSFTKLPVQGTPVMCTSRHNQTLPLLQENIPLYKKAISIKAVLTDRGLEVNGRFSEPDVSEARSASDIKQIIESAFRSSGDSLFTCGDFEFENKSSYEMPFLPLSQLKKARRDFYAQLDADFDRYCADCTAPEGVRIPEINPEDPNVVRMDALMFDEEQYLASMDKVFQQRPDTLFGLNNVAQLLWAEKHPGAKVFADFFLYVKNSAAWTNLNSFAKLQGRVSSMPTEKIPLFISRVCFRHNALNLPCEGCSKNNSYTLTQGGKTFTVNCRNCITTVFLNPQRF